MLKLFIRALLAPFFALMLPMALVSATSAEEVISSYASDVRLATDGTVRVIETITVRAEGQSIRRGIFRDIPTVLINEDGSKLYSNLTINGVKRGGKVEPYHTEGIENGLRIYIGDADVLLATPANYTYTIDYTMTRMGRRFADHDELYWNATGNYWEFPIQSAVASVTLPEGAEITDLQGYTGAYGSTEQAVAISKPAGNRAIFRTTRPLDPYEGMTVSVSFEKGVLATPTGTAGALNYVSDHRADILPTLGVLIVLIYNLWAWNKVGRDPPKGTIIPLFHPPEGYSPAQIHYIHRMGWRNSGWLAFTAGMIDLAVKGLLVLGKEGKKNTITAVVAEAPSDLPREERDLFEYFTDLGTVKVDKRSGPALATQMGQFTKTATGSDKKAWFSYNLGYSALSVVISMIAIGAMLYFEVLDPVIVMVAVFASVMLTVLGVALGAGLRGSIFVRIFIAVWIGFAFINIGGSLLSVFSDAFGYLNIDMPVVAVISILVLNILFGAIMRAPTPLGRAVMDKIDGFKMYLETAEKERLNFFDEPQMTVSRFESILPYAVALGVEKPWTDRFESDLARNAVSDSQGSGYHPRWNSGSDFSAGSMSRTVSSFAAGMSAAMIAAQPSSSSSSGGGGGGSSGGGGGGGGGGGW